MIGYGPVASVLYVVDGLDGSRAIAAFDQRGQRIPSLCGPAREVVSGALSAASSGTRYLRLRVDGRTCELPRWEFELLASEG